MNLQLRNLYSFLDSQDRGHCRGAHYGPCHHRVQDLHRWNLHKLLRSQEHGHHTLQNNRACQQPCPRPVSTGFCAVKTMGISHCITTGMSTTLSKTCNCEISTGVCDGQDHGHLSLKTTGHAQDPHLWNLPSLLHGQDHGHLSLHNGGMSITLTKKCNLESPRASARWQPVVAKQRACQQPYPRPATAESSTGFCTARTVGT